MSNVPDASEIPLTDREYRNTIGMFATGVTVITIGHGDTLRAMTANAISSLSLDPLLLLCCIDKRANCAPYFVIDGKFSLSILNHQQEALSNYFAGIWAKESPPPEFELVRWQDSVRLAGAGAAIECVVHEMIEGGDHWIVVGRVVALWHSETPLQPLIYFQGRYRELMK
jgi:flavin reductase (DIM6/NTAB) family NADH-FMN oxidoreductase RutF